MQTKDNMIGAIVSIVLGLMLLLLKGKVISLALTFLGVLILLKAVNDFRNKQTNAAVIKAVIGLCVLVFGWLFVNLALYLLAAVIICMGLLSIVNLKKCSPVNLTMNEKIFLYAKPVLTVLAGAFLFFNQGGAIDWVFVVTGILLLIGGALELLDLRK